MGRYAAILGAILLIFGFYLLMNPGGSDEQWAPQELTYDPYENWVNYSADNVFSVRFPFYPQNASESIVDTKTQQRRIYDMYVAQSTDGKMFMVSVISFPENEFQEDGQELARRIIMEMVIEKPGVELKQIEPRKLGNENALEFTIDTPQAETKGVAVYRDRKIFLISEIVPEGLEPEEFNYFLNSFKFQGDTNEAK